MGGGGEGGEGATRILGCKLSLGVVLHGGSVECMHKCYGFSGSKVIGDEHFCNL